MRPIPASIRIGGKRVRIRVVTDMDAWGEYHHDLAEIRLSNRALSKASIVRETLRHEVMHAAMNIAGISYMEEFSEEAVVRCMDEIFFPCWDKLSAHLNHPKQTTP